MLVSLTICAYRYIFHSKIVTTCIINYLIEILVFQYMLYMYLIVRIQFLAPPLPSAPGWSGGGSAREVEDGGACSGITHARP